VKLRISLGFVCLLLSACFSLKAQGKTMVFSNINNRSSGWGSCTTCAGGKNQADAYWEAQYQSSPARDGSSAEFYISASKPYSNVLFWDKLGAQDWATSFTWDFWVYVDEGISGAQNLEYDLFQLVDGQEYMFGTQCAYGNGHWDVWNQKTNHWIETGLVCKRFTPKVWHHIVWKFHRTAGYMHFDTLTLDGVTSSINMAEPSGPMPKGWSHSLGVQWQLDTAKNPAEFHEWIDNVTLTLN